MSKRGPCRRGQVPLTITVCLPKDLYSFYKALPKNVKAQIFKKIRHLLAELKAKYEVEYVSGYKPTEE